MPKQNAKLYVGLLGVFVSVLLIITAVMSCGQPTSEPPQESSPAPTQIPKPEPPKEPSPAPTLVPTPEPTPEPSQEPSPTQTPESELPTVPTVLIEEVTTTVGAKCTVRIVFLNATDGLSGYMIRFFLVNSEVAQITNVVLPDFGSTESSNLPNNTVEIAALDVHDIVGIGTEEALLATLELEGLNSGNSGIALEIIAMENDNSNPVEPRILPGSIEVR